MKSKATSIVLFVLGCLLLGALGAAVYFVYFKQLYTIPFETGITIAVAGSYAAVTASVWILAFSFYPFRR